MIRVLYNPKQEFFEVFIDSKNSYVLLRICLLVVLRIAPAEFHQVSFNQIIQVAVENFESI